ncbi:DeoR/GlpR family DNA-binding transcription regulator [Neisseriaceae bacterium CLB008]|nr:DeoR/GlpR transcriptional regulator [Neisseriaceae bacterium]
MSNRPPRHERIIELIRENGFMPIEELARLLEVTPQTVRRDINQLCEENILRRYHGGAALGSSVENDDYFARKDKLQSEKAHIADLIAEHIPENASLFMGIGTTIEAVALALTKTHKGLCIITNNIHVASIMSTRPDYNIMITSGVVRASDGGVTGVATLDFINQFKVDYAVLGVAGIERDGTLLDFDYKEVSVAQAMMANARHCYLVADHTKFGRNALVRMAHITDFNSVFTDEVPDDSMRKRLEEAGVRWYLADKEAK